jgi:hypothetical protein
VKFNVWAPTVGYAADDLACASSAAEMTLSRAALPLATADVNASLLLTGQGLYRQGREVMCQGGVV